MRILWNETPGQLLKLLSSPPRGYVLDKQDGFVGWTPEQWKGGAALCAHVDTVFDQAHVRVIREGSIYRSRFNNRGIGADDRVGVSLAMHVAEAYPGKYRIFFFDKEEAGCQVSRRVILDDRNDIFIGLDRRGIDQAALYGFDTAALAKRLCRLGARVVNGTVSDCSVLAERYNRCCFNLSVGFNSEHTAHEWFDPSGYQFALSMLGKFGKREFRKCEPDFFKIMACFRL